MGRRVRWGIRVLLWAFACRVRTRVPMEFPAPTTPARRRDASFRLMRRNVTTTTCALPIRVRCRPGACTLPPEMRCPATAVRRIPRRPDVRLAPARPACVTKCLSAVCHRSLAEAGRPSVPLWLPRERVPQPVSALRKAVTTVISVPPAISVSPDRATVRTDLTAPTTIPAPWTSATTCWAANTCWNPLPVPVAVNAAVPPTPVRATPSVLLWATAATTTARCAAGVRDLARDGCFHKLEHRGDGLLCPRMLRLWFNRIVADKRWSKRWCLIWK